MTIFGRRSILGFLGALPVAGSLPAFAGESMAELYGKAKQEREVVLYTSVPTFLLDRWKALFEGLYPGVTLNTFRSGTGKVLARLESERQAGKVGGDVAWLADPTSYDSLIQSKALAPFRTPEWNDIRLAKDPNGLYVAGRVLAGVLLANRSVMKTMPQSFADLVKPEFKGKVAIASPLISGSTNIIDGVLLKDPRFGWRYFEQLKANDVLVLSDVPDVARSVASGERPVGISLTMYKYQPEFSASPMEIVVPREGVILIPSPVALLAASPHPAAARLLYRFLLSKPAQQAIAETGTYAARRDVAAPAGLPTWSKMNKMFPDQRWIAANQQENTMRWRELFGG